MSNDPSGAVDRDYDDGLRPPEERIQENETRYERRIGKGDVCVDLITRQPVYVADVTAETVVDYLEVEDFDLIDYKFHPYLPISPTDAVFECVFIPGNPNDLIHGGKSVKTYDFPNGRLARVAIEVVTGGPRPQADIAADVLAKLIRFEVYDDPSANVFEIAGSIFGDVVAREAAERANLENEYLTDDVREQIADGGDGE